MRPTSSGTPVFSVAELGTLNHLMRGTGTVEPFEAELVSRVFECSRAWVQDHDEDKELRRDQRTRWNAAVRRVNRYVSRGGAATSWRVLDSVAGPMELLADHQLLKTAIVAATAHGPVAAGHAATARIAPLRPTPRTTTSAA